MGKLGDDDDVSWECWMANCKYMLLDNSASMVAAKALEREERDLVKEIPSTWFESCPRS